MAFFKWTHLNFWCEIVIFKNTSHMHLGPIATHHKWHLELVWTIFRLIHWLHKGKGILAKIIKMHFVLIIPICLIEINKWISVRYKVLIVTETDNYISFFQIQKKNLKILSIFSTFTYTIFHHFIKNSSILVRFLCWFFICRWIWSVVWSNWRENRSKTNCCKAWASHGSYKFPLIQASLS